MINIINLILYQEERKLFKDGRKINWQKSIDMQLDDKINLFISDGGLRDPDRINALIEEIS